MQPRRTRDEVAESVIAEIRRRELRERRWRAAGFVIPILVLIGLWQPVSWLNTGQHWFFPPLIPSPVDVARAANEEWKLGFLQTDIPASVLRVVFGFLIAAGVGVVLGVLTGSIKQIQWVLHPILEFLRP